MTINQRQQMREMFFQTWAKHQAQQPLQAIEQQILTVILEHPEYQHIFADPEKYMDQDYLPEFCESNPFLHLSLHLSIREQVQTNRPTGINAVYKKLCEKHQYDHLNAEHQMQEVLAETMWSAQKYGQAPDEQQYLQKLQLL